MCWENPVLESIGWQSVAGVYLTQWEQNLLDQWTVDVFGHDAAQLGHSSRLNGLLQSRSVQRWSVMMGESVVTTHSAGAIQAISVIDFTSLPFDSDSMDLLILPHTLNDCDDPHAVLREAYRVLRPEGKIIILGFNPISLWGISAFWSRWRGRKWWAYSGQVLHLHRLKDWLQLLDCRIVQGKFGCYVPYVKSSSWLERWSWMEKAGDRWWGAAGAVYAVMAVKRVYSPTLIGLIHGKKKNKIWVTTPALNTAKQHADKSSAL